MDVLNVDEEIFLLFFLVIVNHAITKGQVNNNCGEKKIDFKINSLLRRNGFWFIFKLSHPEKVMHTT